MKLSTNIYLFLLVIVFFSNCVTEFNPPSKGYENLLAVDALLTDDEDGIKVTLSRSTPIDTNAYLPENGANVQLLSGSGETYQLHQVGDGGEYTNQEIDARVGESYRISIQTRDGKKYESDDVVMINTPEIDSVTFQYEERPAAFLEGIQIYTNTHDPNNNTWFYRWEWEESWEFHMPYDSYLIWKDNQIKEREKRVYKCWKFGESTSIDIASTKRLTQDRIHNFPLLYVSTESDRLSQRYSLLVKQYALSEDSYNYWKELQKVTENLGTLFDPQPSIVFGNIRNVNDPNEIVLGYFDAATVSKQRIFIRRYELPGISLPNRFQFCADSIVSEYQIPTMYGQGWVLVLETVTPTGFPAFLMSTLRCVDCTLYGTNEKPEYW